MGLTIRWRLPPYHAKERAFTLVEMLATTLVFLIGMAGVLNFTMQAARAASFANVKMTASNIGTNVIEMTSLLSYNSVQTRLTSPWTTQYDRQGVFFSGSKPGQPSATYQAVASMVADSQGAPGYVKVEVSALRGAFATTLGTMVFTGPLPPVN